MEITKEVEDFICNNYIGVKNKELTEIINKKFNSNYNIKQIKWIKYKHHLDNKLVKRDCPIGSERIKNGYIFIKVANPQKWVEKQRYIYEKHFGKIPRGYKVMFLDDNITNFDINNLVLVKNREALFVNKNHYANVSKAVKETAINVARLETKIKELERRNKNEKI